MMHGLLSSCLPLVRIGHIMTRRPMTIATSQRRGNVRTEGLLFVVIYTGRDPRMDTPSSVVPVSTSLTLGTNLPGKVVEGLLSVRSLAETESRRNKTHR